MITKNSVPARSVWPASLRLPLAASAVVLLCIGAAMSPITDVAFATAAPPSGTPAPSNGARGTTVSPISPGDAASGELALNAYETYIQALVANTKLGRARDATVVSTVQSTCANTLAPLVGEPSTPVRQVVLSNFGEEIGGDLALKFQSAAVRPFRQLSSLLTSLVWSTPTPANAIKHLLSAERTVLSMPQSALCDNAAAVASFPKVIPEPTQSFLKRYLSASASVNRRLHTFLTVIQGYETAADRPVVSQIDALVAQFSAASQNAEATYSQSIMSDLGLVT